MKNFFSRPFSLVKTSENFGFLVQSESELTKLLHRIAGVPTANATLCSRPGTGHTLFCFKDDIRGANVHAALKDKTHGSSGHRKWRNYSC